MITKNRCKRGISSERESTADNVLSSFIDISVRSGYDVDRRVHSSPFLREYRIRLFILAYISISRR